MNSNSTQFIQTMAGLIFLPDRSEPVYPSDGFVTAATGNSLEMGHRSTPGGSQMDMEVTQLHSSSLQNLFETDYDELFVAGHHNISGEQWYNYSCQSLEFNSSHFIKSFIEPIICCIGITGILITLIVLTRKSMCTSCNCYLTALAVGDLVFLMILVARIIVDKMADCTFHISNERTIFVVYSIIVMDTFQYLSVGVTVMLAVERYIAICHPMRAMGMCTVKRARAIIVVLFAVAFILRCPKFLDIELKHVTTVQGETILVIEWVYPYNDMIYTYIVTCCLLTILPLLALLILNVRIIQEIRRSSRYLQYYLGVDWRVRSVVSSEELKITMMLISVVLAFFVCHVPYMVFSLVVALMEFDTVDNPDLTNSASLKYFRHVCHSLLALKSSCNFVLYCWFSEKFWTTFKRTFCFRRCMDKKSSLRPNGYNNNGRNQRVNSHSNLHRSSYYITKETTC